MSRRLTRAIPRPDVQATVTVIKEGSRHRQGAELVAVVELLPGVLDSHLRRDAGLTHFEHFVLAMLSEADERTLRMTTLAQRTNATLPRRHHVVDALSPDQLAPRGGIADALLQALDRNGHMTRR